MADNVEQMDFCTLGMFIVDNSIPRTVAESVERPNTTFDKIAPSSTNQTPQLSIPGGAGTYSALGARVLSPSPLSHRVGWVVDAGSDFPYELRAIISSWQTGVLLRPRDGLTTKGWNGYGANEHRAFRYLTPKLRITASDLSKSLLTSKSFHLICAPERCIELVTSIKALRSNLPTPLPAPLFIWEPVPDLCVPSQLETTIQALSHVDILSPNHAELADLCGVSADTTAGDVDRSVVEQCAVRLLSGAAKTISTHNPAVVVRSGKSGCLVASSSHNVWLPAYHATNPDKVIDPTGGGNGFLGGFAVGLVRTGDLVQAAVWGNVGASLCIEQVGVPVLGIGKDGAETWNGVNVQVRLSDALKRSGM